MINCLFLEMKYRIKGSVFRILFFVLVILSASIESFSQKTYLDRFTSHHSIDLIACKASFKQVYIGKAVNVENYLLTTIGNLQKKGVSMRLTHQTESPGGVHLLFEQLYNSVKVYRSQIKVNMNKKGSIISLFDNSFSMNSISNEAFPSQVVVNSYAKINGINKPYRHEKVYFSDGNEMLPATRFEIFKGDEFYEIIINNKGIEIYHKDLALYAKAPQDSIVSCKIFLPDPLTTANVTYGTPYIDNNDTDVAELLDQIVSDSMTVTFENDTFKLESPYVKITEHSFPDVQPAVSTTPDFSFTRSQDGFEDVNAFYHINVFQNYIQSLGFDSLVNYQIHVDVHGLFGQDNSMFINTTNPPRLTFGEGGVDDAEDADVIIHEYGHAISHSAAPFTNSGTERQALDEALGDYLASSYSRYLNPFKWENVFSWDGHNEFWLGRSSISTDHYPEDLQNNLYEDADIWSSTIMEIWGDIGREETDKIMLQSLYSYASNMTMSDAALLLIQADSLLNNGLHHTAICFRLYNRGLYMNCVLGTEEFRISDLGFRILNSQGFAIGKNAFIEFNKPVNAIIRLFDATGKLVYEKREKQVVQSIVNGESLPSGIYFLNIITQEKSGSLKLIRF